jgi:hypothetical protein
MSEDAGIDTRAVATILHGQGDALITRLDVIHKIKHNPTLGNFNNSLFQRIIPGAAEVHRVQRAPRVPHQQKHYRREWNLVYYLVYI